MSQTKTSRKNWMVTPDQLLSVEQQRELVALARGLAEKSLKRKGTRHWVNLMVARIGLRAGLRASEIADLRLNDIHIANGFHSLTVRRGKRRKVRTVEIPPDLVDDLRHFLDVVRPLMPNPKGRTNVLLGDEGIALDKFLVSKRAARLLKLAGLNGHSTHDLRHTYATELYRVTKDLRLVQRQLGHSSPNTTAIYAHLVDEDVQSAIANWYDPAGNGKPS